MTYAPSAQTAQRIFQEALVMPLRAVKATVLPSLLLTALVFVSLHNASNQIGLAAWAGTIALSKFNCLLQARRWFKRQITTESARRLIREMRFFYALDGMAWASLIWITLDTCSPIENALAMTAVAGTSISRMTQLSPMLSAYFAFIACGSALWLPRIFMVDDGAYNALGIASLFYILCVISFARGSARTVRQSIELRFENEDLVQQLQVEKTLADKARHKAEEANQAKSKFLAAASHDLRQPAHAQGLILEVMARTALNEQQRELLDNAREVASSSAQMLDTLLDFSRLEAGVIRPKRQDFSTQRLLHKIEREFGPQSDAKGIFYRSRETVLVARSDPALVELILRNLVSNAIRYTERGGLLVSCRRRSEHVEMAVWDTGVGIAAEEQQRVFQEFQQLGNPERDRRKGLGLGLAIADGLARQLGHPLTLSSIPGRGSVFRLTLPLGTLAPAVEPATNDAGWRLRNARVLVIDDDEAVRTGMRHLLTDWGCLCDAAESFEEAVHLAGLHRPQAVISDFRLRGPQTGADVIAALRAALGAPLPALLITGDTAPERLLEAHASGIPLLHKPVPPRDLRRALLDMLGADPRAPAHSLYRP